MPLPARPSRRQSGFTLIELLVVVAVIAILSAIAVPSARDAMRKSRHTAAYKGMKVLETAVQSYMLDFDTPPTSMNTTTLEPLVSRAYITPQQRTAILSGIEGNRLLWYYGYTGGGWYDYDYGFGFRPKKDPTSAWCFLWPEGIWRLEGWTWTQVM